MFKLTHNAIRKTREVVKKIWTKLKIRKICKIEFHVADIIHDHMTKIDASLR
jgi:hypothetical protein